ncbi:MAG: protein-glutamate O-methyltransferase CheR [Eubacteriales bacterium]
MIHDYEWFKKEVFRLSKIDLSAYKEQQMKRRIDSLVSKHNLSDYNHFIKEIQKDKSLYEEFVSFLTINVSEFYRNPEQWKVLDKQILPDLIKQYGNRIKIWSAACSTGDEPYTLVMMLAQHIPLEQVKVFATDLDKQVIATAKNGIYSERSLTALPAEWKKKYFTVTGKTYTISEAVKKRVEFKEHNLLKDSYPAGCHLIVCRNVLIYFTEEAKNEVFAKFNKSLTKDGILFIGSTEQMTNFQSMGYDRKNLFFYHKNV